MVGGDGLLPGRLPRPDPGAPRGGAWVWAVLVGIGTTTFPLILTLIGLRARTPEGTAALSGFAQSVGLPDRRGRTVRRRRAARRLRRLDGAAAGAARPRRPPAGRSAWRCPARRTSRTSCVAPRPTSLGRVAPTVHVPGLVLTDHRLDAAARPRRSRRRPDHRGVRSRGRGPRRPRPTVPGLPPGRPGRRGPRPIGRPAAPAWLGRALQDFRVLMLDQRGTGRSTAYGVAPGGAVADPAADAAYLTHFRADAIVRDAEAFREHLGVERWSVLGQSFGGFCALHYLTAFPDSLREAFFTGGLPPVGRGPDEVYAATYATMRRLNAGFHRRFPGDADRAAPGAGRLRRRRGARPRRLTGHPPAVPHDRQPPRHGRGRREPALPAGARRRARPPSPTTWSACCRSAVATRSTRWSTSPATPTAAPPGGRPTGCAPTTSAATRCCSPASTSTRGTSRTPPSSRRTPRWPGCWPSTPGPGCTTPTRSPPPTCRARPRSTPTTRSSTGSSPRRPRRCCRGCAAWLTDEYLHNGLRFDGGRILDRLIGLARGTL